MERIDRTRETYRKLFEGEPASGEGPDPELLQILQRFIFGEVFFTGDLDDTLRELITIVTLTTQQALPQLQAHTHAALNVGASALAIREAIYLCAPFIGFPRTLNGVSTINEVFAQRNIPLPLESQGTVSEETAWKRDGDFSRHSMAMRSKNVSRTCRATSAHRRLDS